jgi:O-methyltransferase
MKTLIKSTVNTVLGTAGLAVVQQETIAKSNRSQVMDSELIRFLSEVEEGIRNTTLPKLPKKKNRHDIMIDSLNFSLQPFFLLNYLNEVLNVPGDVCEFGCSHGASTALFANEILATKKSLWIYDSFEGLSKPTEKDVLINDIAHLGSIDKYEGEMAHPQERVVRRLLKIGFPATRTYVVPGFIEKTAKLGKFPNEISFAYIDFDFYEPIKTGLTIVKDRLHPKGIIVVDDYGFFSAGAQTAVDEFIQEQQGRFVLEKIPDWGGKCVALRRSC